MLFNNHTFSILNHLRIYLWVVLEIAILVILSIMKILCLFIFVIILIVLGYLSYDILFEECKKFGPIVSISLHSPSGNNSHGNNNVKNAYAFVEFEAIEDAIHFYSAINYSRNIGKINQFLIDNYTIFNIEMTYRVSRLQNWKLFQSELFF